MRLMVVKSPEEDATCDENSGINHGAAMTRRLVEHWKKADRIVCGDSYFAFVATVQELHRIGRRFIGVVKTAHRNFPSKYLGSRAMDGRGKWFSMIHEGELDIGALLWIDRERRHFVSSVGTALPGANIYRERWRRVDGISKLVVTETQIPQIAETYYAAASMINRHNRCRQQDLQLEKKFLVRDWSIRVNTSLFAICIVDSWLLYKSSQGGRTTMSPNEFIPD